MFESVLLPAPFSPSSACTSPAAASKSTRSFATTPGNDFEMPRIAWPATLTTPAVGVSMPEITPASAAWPLPETPARPVISPA